MKKELVISVFFVLCLVYAKQAFGTDYTCETATVHSIGDLAGTAAGQAASCTGGYAYVGTYPYYNTSHLSCGDALIASTTSMPFPSQSHAIGPCVVYAYSDANFSMIVNIQCCTTGLNQADMEGHPMEITIGGEGVVSGVSSGNELSAAQTACANWSGSHVFPDGPTGTIRTDGMLDIAYKSGVSGDGSSSTVNYVCAKRGGYQPAGGVVTPLGQIPGGGGGGGGLNITDTTTAVSNALNAQGPNGSGISGAFQNALNAVGLNGTTIGNALQNALAAVFGAPATAPDAGSYTQPSDTVLNGGGDISETANPNILPSDKPSKRSITDRLTTFFGSNPLMSLAGSSGIDIVDSNVCSFGGTMDVGPIHDKQVNFSLCGLESAFESMGTVVLLVSTLGALFICFGYKS